MSEQRLLVAQFCDDVRQEVGNKYSLMGCYTEELIVDKLPAVLPKLCAQVRVTTPIDNPFTKFVLRAHLNGETIAEMDVGIADLTPPDNKLELKRMGVMAIMSFSPLVVTDPGKLEIEAETEDGVLKGNALSIRARTEGEMIPWQSHGH
ncbi:MAG: hypothetical protein HGA75_00895 [Thiobacillus sp.]|nr:hypothetical protein [Thiobacillus sp.]